MKHTQHIWNTDIETERDTWTPTQTDISSNIFLATGNRHFKLFQNKKSEHLDKYNLQVVELKFPIDKNKFCSWDLTQKLMMAFVNWGCGLEDVSWCWKRLYSHWTTGSCGHPQHRDHSPPKRIIFLFFFGFRYFCIVNVANFSIETTALQKSIFLALLFLVNLCKL